MVRRRSALASFGVGYPTFASLRRSQCPLCRPTRYKVNMSDTRTAWAQIHLCVFLWGFTAIIGKLITVPALPLVLWRMLMVSLMLLLLPRVWRGMLRLSRRDLLAFLGVGVIVAVHWLTFYAAVKLANASVAATCMALIPVCLCFIEPMVTGRPFVRRELLLGLLVLPGVALVVGGTPETMNAGIAVAILSAFLAALFTALNKRLIHRTDALSATALEMLGGGVFALVMTLLLFGLPWTPWEAGALLPAQDKLLAVPGSNDMFWILLLAVACTLLPFALSLVALRQLSAYASSLAVNMEPLYAIILAILILGEQRELDLQFYLGAGIILGVVLVYPVLMNSHKQVSRALPASESA